MKYTNSLKLGALLIGGMLAFNATAAPNTQPSKIKLLRPYSNGTMFVQVSTSTMTDNTTCTSVYSVQSDKAGAKNVIATLLTAHALDQNVEIEVSTAGGCAGYATPIESVYLR